MSETILEIATPGMLTTVQDRGRYGYQRFGVPVSGAMDEFALRSANLLVGNEQGAACLEMTVLGPTIGFLSDTRIAITGGDLTALMNGSPVPRWETIDVSEGDELSFQGMQDGMRAYLAVAGGIDVPVVMGSRSTYTKSAIGGFEGRALATGDVVAVLTPGLGVPTTGRRLPRGYEVPTYGEHHELRVVLGPQHDAFGEDAIDALLGSTFTISLESDRMGYKLEGAQIGHKDGPDIVSDGNPPGAIQVPGDGVPTILLADRGTTGGYTKIATVISADLGRVAQGVPGQTVSLRAVELEEATLAAREMEAVLAAIASGSDERISVSVDGEAFDVVDEEGRVTSPGPATEAGDSKRQGARATVDGQTFEFGVEVRRQGWAERD